MKLQFGHFIANALSEGCKILHTFLLHAQTNKLKVNTDLACCLQRIIQIYLYAKWGAKMQLGNKYCYLAI